MPAADVAVKAIELSLATHRLHIFSAFSKHVELDAAETGALAGRKVYYDLRCLAAFADDTVAQLVMLQSELNDARYALQVRPTDPSIHIRAELETATAESKKAIDRLSHVTLTRDRLQAANLELEARIATLTATNQTTSNLASAHESKSQGLQEELNRVTDRHRIKTQELEGQLACITDTLESTKLSIITLNDGHRTRTEELEGQLARVTKSLESTNSGITALVDGHRTKTEELEGQLACVTDALNTTNRMRIDEELSRVTDSLKSTKSTQSTIAALKAAHEEAKANLITQHGIEIQELENRLASTVIVHRQEAVQTADDHRITVEKLKKQNRDEVATLETAAEAFRLHHCVTVADLGLEIDSGRFIIERAYAVVSSLESQVALARASNTTLSAELTHSRELVQTLTTAADGAETQSTHLRRTIDCRDHEVGSYRILYMALARQLSVEQAVTRTLRSELLTSQLRSQALGDKALSVDSALSILGGKHEDLGKAHNLLASQHSDLMAAHDVLLPAHELLGS
ncbi:hypothetical protein HBH53_256080, partial [Parastagonospora nodorum]